MTHLPGKDVFLSEGGPGAAAARSSESHCAGEALRRQREALRLDLDEVAATLRIKPCYLAALEAGRADQLPGYAYALGFVRTYAGYLGLDTLEVLRRFREGPIGLPEKPELSFLSALGERRIPGGTALLTAALLAICGYGIWHYLSAAETGRPERVAPVPSELLPHTAASPPAFGASAPADWAGARPDSALPPPAASAAPAQPAARATARAAKGRPRHKR